MHRLALIFIFMISSCQRPGFTVEKPTSVIFGASIDSMRVVLKSECDSMSERSIEPIQLPTAKLRQTQIDCEGFIFAGKKRKMELIFADDTLDMVWILTTAAEESLFIDQCRALYGTPTHVKSEVTFFLNDGIAIRNQPHEVLFISDRLKEPYRAWLEH